MKKNKHLITFMAHIIGWICFFSLPFIFWPRSGAFRMSDNMIASFICINAFLFGFYYLNVKLLIPRLFKTKRWPLYTAGVVTCFLVFMFVPKPLANAIAPPEPAEAFYKNRNLPVPKDAEERFRKRKNITHYPSSYLGFVLVFAIGLAVTSIQEWLRSEETKTAMEHEKLNTELSLLKSQINPHFFFNTLNNIYSLAITRSEETASSILKLSAIMRYVLTESEHKLVPLEKEIEFIQNYINLQTVRLTSKVKVQMQIEGDTANKLIPPLLFIAFVENAFKYGVSTVEETAINISLHAVDHKIIFSADNDVVKAAKHSNINTGIGIVNVQRRLELLFPRKHRLTIREENDRYLVHLEIDLV